jgi:hypothetical protein
MGAAAIGEMLARIALQQEAEHTAPVLHGRLGFRLNHHPIGGRGGARGYQLALSLDRNQADPAIADDR